ncbi:MAG: hypothetical protein WA584_17620 [Pyrinomonadaceae bacterium]
MRDKELEENSQVVKKPVVLFIAKEVEEVEVGGNYSSITETWSDRNYELASDKKHNEDM